MSAWPRGQNFGLVIGLVWRHGVAITPLGVSTKLLYVGPGYYWDGWPSSDGQITSVCNQPPRPTQPPTLSGTGNEYRPKCGDALRLRNKGRYGSFHLYSVSTKTPPPKYSIRNTWQTSLKFLQQNFAHICTLCVQKFVEIQRKDCMIFMQLNCNCAKLDNFEDF